ncbi:MAG TPA: molybdopterin molybdenumtransferase MoeA, partial [Xanthomonadaceae bacterium]|nr:molybdopterin molybdenumtransferase MoeA [Xanthomonadaceae bacterium]
MIDFDAACSLIGALPDRVGTEPVPTARAAGRVLARDVVAGLDMPRHAVSAMDGYAVRDADLARLPARLAVAGVAFAGQEPLPEVAPGCCVRVFTGARIPEGFDRVVVQEDVREQGPDAVFEAPLAPKRHIRAAAS